MGSIKPDGDHLVAVARVGGVPVVAGPDLDVLNDQAVLSRLVAALRGTWADMAAEHSSATQQLRHAAAGRPPTPPARHKKVAASGCPSMETIKALDKPIVPAQKGIRPSGPADHSHAAVDPG